MCRNSFPSRNTAVAQFLFVLISSFIALVYSLVLNSCWCLGLIRYPLDWMFELHLIHIHSWHPVGIFRDETAGRLASDLVLNANRLKLGRLFHESLSDPSDHPWSRELEVTSLEIHVMSELSLCRHSSCQQNSRRRFHLSQLRLWESLWMVLHKSQVCCRAGLSSVVTLSNLLCGAACVSFAVQCWGMFLSSHWRPSNAPWDYKMCTVLYPWMLSYLGSVLSVLTTSHIIFLDNHCLTAMLPYTNLISIFPPQL